MGPLLAKYCGAHKHGGGHGREILSILQSELTHDHVTIVDPFWYCFSLAKRVDVTVPRP